MSSDVTNEFSEEFCGPGFSHLRAARRRRILDSAQRTFLRDGYRGATMERVAEDAGVSKQTLYNYFADKEELFASLLQMHHETLTVAMIEEALDRVADGDPREALHAAALALFRYGSTPETATLHRIMIELLMEQPDLMLRLRNQFFLRNVERVSAALERGAAAGKLRHLDAEAVTYVLFGTAAAYGMFRPAAPDDRTQQLTPERMAAALADLLGDGIVAQATTSSESGRAGDTVNPNARAAPRG